MLAIRKSSWEVIIVTSEQSTKSAFNQTMQIGIVVPDVAAAARTYETHYGIGGWQHMELDGTDATDVRLRGQPVDWRARIAVTMVGSVMWELIEPISPDDLFGRFLASRGGVGGVHHIAVRTPDFAGVVAAETARGRQSVLSGTFSGVEVHYLDTEPELGVMLEVFSHMPEGVPEPGL